MGNRKLHELILKQLTLSYKGHNCSPWQHSVERMPTILLSYIDTMSKGAVCESQLPCIDV